MFSAPKTRLDAQVIKVFHALMPGWPSRAARLYAPQVMKRRSYLVTHKLGDNFIILVTAVANLRLASRSIIQLNVCFFVRFFDIVSLGLLYLLLPRPLTGLVIAGAAQQCCRSSRSDSGVRRFVLGTVRQRAGL